MPKVSSSEKENIEKLRADLSSAIAGVFQSKGDVAECAKVDKVYDRYFKFMEDLNRANLDKERALQSGRRLTRVLGNTLKTLFNLLTQHLPFSQSFWREFTADFYKTGDGKGMSDTEYTRKFLYLVAVERKALVTISRPKIAIDADVLSRKTKEAIVNVLSTLMHHNRLVRKDGKSSVLLKVDKEMGNTVRGVWLRWMFFKTVTSTDVERHRCKGRSSECDAANRIVNRRVEQTEKVDPYVFQFGSSVVDDGEEDLDDDDDDDYTPSPQSAEEDPEADYDYDYPPSPQSAEEDPDEDFDDDYSPSPQSAEEDYPQYSSEAYPIFGDSDLGDNSGGEHFGTEQVKQFADQSPDNSPDDSPIGLAQQKFRDIVDSLLAYGNFSQSSTGSGTGTDEPPQQGISIASQEAKNETEWIQSQVETQEQGIMGKVKKMGQAAQKMIFGGR